MKDNNTHITLTDLSNNKNFIDTNVISNISYTEDDYKGMQEIFDSYDTISKIQEITGKIFNFNPDEYNLYKPTYDIAYACLMNPNSIIKKEIDTEVIVSNEDLDNFKVGDKKDISSEIDSIILFGEKITFKAKIIILKDAEIMEIYKEDNFKIGLACIFLTIAAILGLAREFSVMKKEKFCKIPDHIEIGPTVKCPYCKGKMIKGMHKS
mgnify:CR=1 FL=1